MPGVERRVGAERPQPIVGRAEVDRALRGLHAGAEHRGELTLGAGRPLDPLVVDIEVRVLAVPDPDARGDARERPMLERALELERGARVPPQVSGTESRSPAPSRSIVLTRPP